MQGAYYLSHQVGSVPISFSGVALAVSQFSDFTFVIDPDLLQTQQPFVRIAGRFEGTGQTIQFQLRVGGDYATPDGNGSSGTVLATSPVYTAGAATYIQWDIARIDLSSTGLTRLHVTYTKTGVGNPDIWDPYFMLYGEDEVDDCGLPFHFDSVQTFAGGTKLRLWFTRETASGAVPGDFTLTGTSGQDAPAISMVTKASDDTDVYDLYLAAAMLPGTYTVEVADTVLSASGHPVADPRVFAFDWSPIFQEPISHGAANRDVEEQFLRKLNPAFRKRPNWQAFARALAQGDAMTRRDAQLAFDQLFLSSAVGKYLTRRAGDQGIVKPEGPGLSDNLFRQLALAVKNEKLTSHAMLDVLEVFYGEDATHAYIDTDVLEPYPLISGSTLELLIDERHLVRVEFPRAHFTTALRATAAEVAAVITRACNARRTKAYAVAQVDPATGDSRVRVYSGSRGLGSSVRVVGGTAQPALLFPNSLFEEPDVAPADFGAWTVTKPDTNTVRWTYDGDFFDFEDIRIGDYVVIRGIEFEPTNRGAGPITDVNFEVGNSWFEVENPSGTAQADVTQCEFGDLEFFRPTKRTIYDAPVYALLWQHDGDGFASIAATTRAIQRQKYSGAYLQVPDAVAGGDTISRTATTVTVTTLTPHGMVVGDWFDLDGPDDGTFTGPGMTGRHVVATVPGASSFTYRTPNYSATTTGAGSFSVTPCAAGAGAAAGPFILDPDGGFGLTGTTGTTQADLLVGQRYALLELAPGEGADFPDEEGWLVFRLGYSNQVGPVKYLGNTGDDTLLIDASFQFPATVATGATVNLLTGRGPFVPDDPETIGAFYLTAAPAGRVAAEAFMTAISAAGVDLDIEIRYPGDRGLGGEGLPARRAYKVSDKVAVWGGDELDAELEAARNGDV
jgi:hypothetical protein